MNEETLTNPHIIIGNKEVEIHPYDARIKKSHNPTIELISFEIPFKLTQENLDFVKSIQNKIKIYQDTRYNDCSLSSIENPVSFELSQPGKIGIHNAIILDLKYETIDFNKLHIFHMKDDVPDYLIDRGRYQEICSTGMNRIIAYGVCAKID